MDLGKYKTKDYTNIHSELHQFIDETREMFGDNAKKGIGSFSFYLGRLKGVDMQTLYQFRSEVVQAREVKSPSKLFFWKIKQLK